MTTDIAVRPDKQLTVEQLKFVANAESIPKAYRNNMPAIMACVLTGRELGLGDMQSLRMIHVVEGKANMGAELMCALARQHGHSITGNMGEEKATAVGKRGDNGDTMTVTWTMDMAKRAGLSSKQNWQKYPEAMLWARAVSQLCRALFPDIFMGLAYTGEELGEEAVTLQVVESARTVEGMTVSEPDDDDESVEAEVVDDTSDTQDFDDDALFDALEVPR